MTEARLLILQQLAGRSHTTPERIHVEAEPSLPGLSLSTVYRTLQLFVEQGLVGCTNLGGQSRAYHLPSHGDHMHLVCSNCGTIAELSATVVQSFAVDVLALSGYRLEDDHLTLPGVCPACGVTERSPDWTADRT